MVMTSRQRLRELQALIGALLLATATGCLKSKLADPNAIRTGAGANARHLASVAVQTDSGQGAICLYSVPSEVDSSASLEPAALEGAQVVTTHALYQGELIQGLESIPGIDAFRNAAINDLTGPQTAVLLGTAAMIAGRTLPGAAAAGAQAIEPIMDIRRLLPAQSVGRELRTLGILDSRFTAREARLFEETKKRLIEEGFRLDGNAALATMEQYKKRKLSLRQWLESLNGLNQAGNAVDVKSRVNAVLSQAQEGASRFAAQQDQVRIAIVDLMNSPTEQAVARARALVARFGGANVAVASAAETQANRGLFKGVGKGVRAAIPESFQELCGKGASGKRLLIKAGLCTAGAATIAVGVGWGIGNLLPSTMTINKATMQAAMESAEATQGAGSDVVLDRPSYDKLVAGLTAFSNQLSAADSVQAMRPTCQ
jgi:hypothetical protein